MTDNSDKAVATPAAVQMLKADYALWMYRVAGGGSSYLTMAEKAIEALNLSASRLESDYAQVFSSANKLNKEVIFAVHQANGEAVQRTGLLPRLEQQLRRSGLPEQPGAHHRRQPVVVVHRPLQCAADLGRGATRARS